MYNIGNNQIGTMPGYNYLYSASQILTQQSPYYYSNYQGQGGFHGGYSRDYQMGYQGNNLLGLNYLQQNQTQQQHQQQSQQQNQQNLQQQNQQHNQQSSSQQQIFQQSHQHLPQSQSSNNLQVNHHSNSQAHRNSESHEKENVSKERSVKRNNSNIMRDRSNEKLSFNKSTPHFYPQQQQQQQQQDNYNSNNNQQNGGNFQSSNNSGNMTSSNGANFGNNFFTSSNNNNTGSQTNIKDNDKINQIQKIYNNNIRSRNNFHKSQNNFYNTHTNAFFNSNGGGSNNTNGNNNGSLDQRKKNGLSSRLSQSPSTDMKMSSQTAINRKYYPSQTSLKLNQHNSQNQNPLISFQKENNNLANIYSKEYKTNRNSLTSGKTFEKKDSFNQIYKPPIKGQLNQGSINNIKHQTTVNPQIVYQNSNAQTKFYQTEPNFNKKPSKKSFQIIKPNPKPQLKPIEDLIMNENVSVQNQIGRKYFSNTSTNQSNTIFNASANKWSLTPKQQFNSSTSMNKLKKKEEILNPLKQKSKTFGSEDRKNIVQGRDNLIQNHKYDYDYDMEFEEDQQQHSQLSKNPEQLYSYDIDIDQPISSTSIHPKTKQLTQVDEENLLKNTLATNEDLQQDNINSDNLENDRLNISSKQKDLIKNDNEIEQKNNFEQLKKEEDKPQYQKYSAYPLQSSNYGENRKSINNFELEVIQEQNKEDEVKDVPLDLLQQVLKISESRPKTSEGGRRRRRLKQVKQQQADNLDNDDLQSKVQENAQDDKQKKEMGSSIVIKNQKGDNNLMKQSQDQGGVSRRKRNESNGSEIYDLIENSPKQLDFSPLKTQWHTNQKEDEEEVESNGYDYEFDDCESDQRGENINFNKSQPFFRSQVEFYRPSETESHNEPNYNATHYGGSSFKQSWNADNYQKKQRESFRRTINEGFDTRYEQEVQLKYSQGPKMFNLFKRNSGQPFQQNEDNQQYSQQIPSKYIAPNGDIPIEVHVQDNDNEYVYQETSQRKKVLLKKKTIDTSDGHKIIIRHNKSAAGPKRIPKTQQNENIADQNNKEQSQKQTEVVSVKPIEYQDDVVERGVVHFKTGLDNEFINLFASQPN